MKIPKKAHRKQTSLCKTLTKLLATGLACAAVLVGSQFPVTSANGNVFHGNTGSIGSWNESGDCGENGTDNGQGISPQSDGEVIKDANK